MIGAKVVIYDGTSGHHSVDRFFSGKSEKHVRILENLITKRENICISGIILTEILQGIRNDRDYSKTKLLLGNLIFLPVQYSSYILSAEMYRKLRRRGITIRKTMDCMIASVAIEHDTFFCIMIGIIFRLKNILGLEF